MKSHLWIVMLLILVVIALLAYSSAFIVDFREIVIVKTFGKASPPIYGADNAGIYFKWPYPVQTIVRYDARTQVFEDTGDEIGTSDQQKVSLSVFCAWRIKDADRFLRQVRTENAQEAMRALVRDRKQQVVSTYPLAAFVNTDTNQMLIGEMEQKVLDSIRATAEDNYGIEVSALGFRSLGLSEAVSAKVIDSMKEERTQLARGYEALGKAVADDITSRAESAREQILAFANSLARGIEAKARQEEAEYYPVFAQDPEFAIILRRIDFLKEAFSKNTRFVIDPAAELSVGYFSEDPKPAVAGTGAGDSSDDSSDRP
jgi:membrane protease subunit HflC